MKPPTQGSPVCSVPLHITQDDIDQMDYWLNEAGVSSPANENAICFAIQRLVLPNTKIALRQSAGKMKVELDQTAMELPEELANWYRRALMGEDVRPVLGWLNLPRRTLSVEARRLMAGTRPAFRGTKPEGAKPALEVEAA